MGKPLINTKLWTRNDIRMLIISLFIFVYPVLAGSLFMVLLFFALPRERIPFVGSEGISAAHAYWLIASGAWMLLLTIILPLMRDKHEYQPTGSHGDKNDYKPTGSKKEPKNKAKEHGSTEKIPMVHVRVQAAEMENINRDSILTNRSSHKSDDISNNSVEKGTLEEKADKETLEKLQRNVNNSKENIQKSLESINPNDYTLKKRKSMMHSGEFLNDCIGNFEEDNKKQGDDDILEDENKKQVHADVYIQNESINDKEKDSNEKENKDDDSDIEMINETQDMNGKIKEDKSDKNKPDNVEDDNKRDSKGNQSNLSITADIESQIHSTELVIPAPLKVVDKQLCQEAIIDDDDDDDDDDEEEEELGELVPSLAQRRNIENPSVDTSLANASYSDPIVTTPLSAASLNRRNSNVVHLFVKGDT